ncbi:alpha/beta family hydrolase [Pseudalkalibacillus caeni]|uniref:Alpha/beta hydrolase n=1 Tax=Exobacillus caeni TaxID=2574798 RepID=A0A5R9F416_9BACL|nr:alpha/beta family hydrolase [Pseudalkalibacillus caeni]TLS37239.1 hypothetical protein FCL54_11990 [Pseudalkalibacillus caeni]
MELLHGKVNASHEIPYTLIKQGKVSSKLGTILPGMGYTVQAPLLHYSTHLLLSKGYDVLHANYNYRENETYLSQSEEEQDEQICGDITTVMNEINSEAAYKEHCFIGKSLGTVPLTNLLLTDDRFHKSRSVFLTPLIHEDTLYKEMLKIHQQSLFIIGDKDPCYRKQRFDELTSKSNNSSLLIEGTNHSLEFEDNYIASLQALRQTLQRMDAFL